MNLSGMPCTSKTMSIPPPFIHNTTSRRLHSNRGWIRRPYSTWLVGFILITLSVIGNIFVNRLQEHLLTRYHVVIPSKEIDPSTISTRFWSYNGTDSIMKTDRRKGKKKNRTATTTPTTATNATSHPVFPRKCLSSPPSELVWEWHYYSSKTTVTNSSSVTTNVTTTKVPKQRLLIATYSAFGEYARLLEWTAPINKAYAKQWGHDMVVLQGTSMIVPWDKNCTPPEERSRFNKIDLLSMALKKRNQYDQLLILDADTLIYDFDFDITQLASSNTTMLVALRTQPNDNIATKSINNGITLWNLHHPLTPDVAYDWNRACRRGIPDNRPFRGDQFYLHQVLESTNNDRIAAIASVWEEFYYRDGTVIKHFQRSDDRSWDETGLDSREERIHNTTMEICRRYDLDLNNLDIRSYTTTPQVPMVIPTEPCVPSRESAWELLTFGGQNNRTNASKRLLVAQYSSYGNYSTLLEATAPYNKAYARRWNHDSLVVQGAALRLASDEPGCEPPLHRSMYNKIPLLLYALSRRDEYDQVLILDADALIVQMDFDITTLLDEGDMLAAQRASIRNLPNSTSSNGGVRPWSTWNLNIGITLWNLHHPKTGKVAKEWFKRSTNALNDAQRYGWKDHGDQYYLQMLLKYGSSRFGNVENYTHALVNEFRYEYGSIIQHYVRSNHSDWSGNGQDHRQGQIERATQEICEQYPLDCENLEHIPYSSL